MSFNIIGYFSKYIFENDNSNLSPNLSPNLEEKCIICFEKNICNNNIYKCKHNSCCQECSISWYNIKKSCPICRAEPEIVKENIRNSNKRSLTINNKIYVWNSHQKNLAENYKRLRNLPHQVVITNTNNIHLNEGDFYYHFQ